MMGVLGIVLSASQYTLHTDLHTHTYTHLHTLTHTHTHTHPKEEEGGGDIIIPTVHISSIATMTFIPRAHTCLMAETNLIKISKCSQAGFPT